MTGETPQPAETPRDEGNPWSLGDPGVGWWRDETDRSVTDAVPAPPRHPRRRAPRHEPATGATGVLLPPGQTAHRHTGAAAEAHAAAARDVAGELHPATRQRTEPVVVERNHDQSDPHRYDPLRPPAGYTGRQAAGSRQAAETTTEATAAPTAEATAAPTAEATAAPTAAAPTAEAPTEAKVAPAGPVQADPAAGTDQAPGGDATPEPITSESPIGPDVMLLPEPSPRNRPTVALDPGAPPERGPIVPGLTRQGRGPRHPTEPLPHPTGSPHTDARLERLENSPFWETDLDQLTEPPVPDRVARAGTRRDGRRATRKPAPALCALVLLGLVATFFAWVSAEPFWLTLGHGDRGYATTTRCTGSSVTQRCTGRFTAADGGFTISRVTLLGVGPAQRVPGTVSSARMVSPDSPRAYLGDTSPLLQLRWVLGFALMLFCGYAIAGVTGARRLETARHRRGAILLSLACPLLLLAGFLIAAY